MRNEQLSVLKGIGIIGMVIGHSGCPTFLCGFIYLFHMSLFYFASGYFFKETALTHKWEFVKKRIKGLYVPFLKYGFIFLALHNVFFLGDIYNGEYGFSGKVSSLYTETDFLKMARNILVFGRTEQLLGAYWFLYSLFVSSILFCFIYWGISRFFRSHTKIYLFLVISVIYLTGAWMCMKEYRLPRGGEREMVACGVFYLGYLYHANFFAKRWCIKYNFWLILSSLVLLILASFVGEVSLVTSVITDPLFFVVVTFLGCYMIMGISDYLVRFRIPEKVFSYIGNHTLEILTFHFFAFKIVSLLKIGYYHWDITRLAEFPVIEEKNTFWWILYTLVGISAPLGFSLFIGRIDSFCRGTFARCMSARTK